MTLEAMLELGRDDCGLTLDDCPGPAPHKRWEEGRPCSRQASLGWGVLSRGQPVARRRAPRVLRPRP